MNVLVKASELSPLMAASWLRSTLRAALDGGRQPGADEVFTLWRDSVEPSLSAVEAETLAPLVVRATSELHQRAGAACRTLVERLADLEANLEAKETGTSGVAPSETGGWPEPDLPGKPPPPEPFPLGVLPRLAQAFVVEAARSLGAEPAFPALFAFGVMAVAIGGSCVVEVKPGWHESTNLYLLAVAQPGGGKSPALATALRPLEAIQAMLAEQNRLTRQSYEDELAEYERARQGHRKGQGVTLPGKPEEPAERRLFVTSATIEALADALNDNPAGIALIQDEGAAWVRSVNQYRSGRGADRQFYLSCWSRAWVEIIRRTARNVSVPTPHLTVLGGLPPEVLGDLADEAGRDDGFLHRVLFAWPDDVMTRLNTEQIPAGVTQAWERFVHSLVVREHVRVLGLTPDAFALAKNWLDGLSEAFRAETLPAFLLGPAAKMKSHLFRFALILHVGEHAGEELSFVPPVDVSAVQKAISLGGFFLAHARRVIPELLAQSGRDDGGEGLEAYVLERILQTGGLELDRRTLWRKVKGKAGLRRVDDLAAVLRELQDRGCIRLRERDPAGGRPPSPVVEINPALLVSSVSVPKVPEVSQDRAFGTYGTVLPVVRESEDAPEAGDCRFAAGERANTPQGAGSVWQTFQNEIKVHLDSTGKVAAFKPGELTRI